MVEERKFGGLHIIKVKKELKKKNESLTADAEEYIPTPSEFLG